MVGYVGAWLLLAAGFTAAFFATSSTETSVAGHDAVVQTTLDGKVTLRTGPFLPDVRAESGRRLGVDIVLGKTEVGSLDSLVERYAFLASSPEAQAQRVEDDLQEMLLDAAVRGGLVAVVPLLLWAAVGPARRRELGHRASRHRAWVAGGTAVSVAAGVLAWEPWEPGEPMYADPADWIPLEGYVAGVEVPEEAREYSIELSGEASSQATRRLIASAISTYEQSRDFYDTLVDRVDGLDLRRPEEDETVAVLVSDRHDNVGMDAVARAVGDRAGATVVLNAGDDTSTGAEWEAFSLDSVAQAFDDYEAWAVSGNHDHGDFVRQRLAGHGWHVAEQEVVDGPGGGRLLAYDDPRSSGLGNWRDERGLSIPDLAEQVADTACASEERVNTLLVHDDDLGTPALERGCVDLVLAGHLHARRGPEQVRGENGEVGWKFINGTTGGAAYALAVGSKLRRHAMITLVTYRDGVPVGLQVVTARTDMRIVAGRYEPLVARPGEARTRGSE